MSDENKNRDFELVGRAQAGDGRAFEELIKTHDRRVFNLAFTMVGNLADAQDVYQETFMRAWSAIASFRFQSSFLTWLLRIAVNQSLTFRKRRKLRSFLSLHDQATDSSPAIHFDIAGDSNAEKALYAEETLHQINKAMEKLTAKERAVFTLRHFQDIKIKEISSMLDYAEGTVKNLLFRASRKMQKSLKPYFEDDLNVLS